MELGFKFFQIGVINGFPQQMYFDLDNISIREFIDTFTEKFGRQLKEDLLNEQDRLRPEYVIILNGVNISERDSLDTIIPRNSEFLLTVQMYGG